MSESIVQKTNPLGTEKVGTLLRTFSIPSIISMLVGALYNIVDQIFIGQKIGELGNAATNVAFPLSTASVAIALLMGIGGAAAFNLASGRGETEKGGYIIGNSVTILIILGTVLMIVTQLFLEPLLRFFGSPENVLGYAKTYTGIVSFGFPFLILSTGATHLIRADGSPKYAMFCNLSGAILNTILDPIFIFVLDMDMAGAAIATILGQMLSFVLAIGYLRKFRTVKLVFSHFIPRVKYFSQSMILGLAPAFNQSAMMLVQIIMNKSLVFYGALSAYGAAIPLASAGVITKTAMIFFSIIIGISQGMQPVVSFNYGAKKYDRVKEAYKTSLKVSLIISIFAFLLFQLFPRQIVSVFGEGSPEYFAFSTLYFRIFMFFTFINCIQPISANFFTAIGKPHKGMFLSLTRQIIFLLPLIFFLPLRFGIDGVVYAGPIADFFAAMVSIIFVRKEFKKMY